jgi:hypothetical protein
VGANLTRRAITADHRASELMVRSIVAKRARVE